MVASVARLYCVVSRVLTGRFGGFLDGKVCSILAVVPNTDPKITLCLSKQVTYQLFIDV